MQKITRVEKVRTAKLVRGDSGIINVFAVFAVRTVRSFSFRKG